MSYFGNLALNTYPESQPVNLWRLRIFYAIFTISAVLGSVALVLALKFALEYGLYLNAAIYSAVYLLLLIIIILRRIPFPIRAYLGCFLFYFLGLVTFLSFGPVGSGLLLLFTFSVVSSLLIGFNFGLAAILINVTTILVVGIMFNRGLIQWDHISEYTLRIYSTSSAVFIFANTAVAISLALVVRGLEKALVRESQTIQQVEISNKNLLVEIQDRKDAEAAIKTSEEKYRNLFDNAQVGMFRTKEDGSEVIEVNQKVTEITGFSKTELLSAPSVMIWVDPNQRLELISQLRQRGAVSGFEANIKTRSNEIITCLIAIQLYSEEGILEGSLVDITNLKRAEEQLKLLNKKLTRSNQDLEQFAYISSHDLQEPLRKIRAFSDRLAVKYADVLDEKGQQYLNRLQHAATRMQNLIEDLLTYSRVTTQPKSLQKIDLKILILQILDDLEIRIEQSKAQIKIDSLPEIEADPTQFRLLFQNLIGNALKFHRPGHSPEIQISSLSIESRARKRPLFEIRVSDRGIGIDPVYFDRIFKIFHRLHTQDEYQGSGIGLAVCKKIVERHAGRIRVESTPGLGSTFRIILPPHQSDEHLPVTLT